MYGKYVTLSNDDQEIEVFVFCDLNTSREELVKRAKQIVKKMN